MTISINGTSIGDLKTHDLTCPNYVCEPETPQGTPIPAYRSGRGSDKLSITIVGLPIATYFSTLNTLKGYVDGQEVVYVKDSTYNIYGASTGVWVVLSEVKGSISSKELGEISFTGTITTDHTDSSYTPS